MGVDKSCQRLYILGVDDLVEDWYKELYVVSQHFPTEDSLRKLLLKVKDANAKDVDKRGELNIIAPPPEGADPVSYIRITFEGQDLGGRIAELKARAGQRTDYLVHVKDMGEITGEELEVLEKFTGGVHRIT